MHSMNDQLAIGVDFGATSIKMGVVQGSRILESSIPLATQEYDSPESIMEAMLETIGGLMEKHSGITAIGLGMPGWCDYYKGVLYQLTNVPVWDREVPVKEVFERRLNLPVTIDNDANCMAYAEWKLGAGKNRQNLVCLTLGTGIGGGIIIHNQMVRGRRCSAGELGQTSINWNGRRGHFGNLGAIEDYIGNNELAVEAQLRYAHEGQRRELEECTPRLLSEAALKGDRIALALWDDYAQKLASLIMNMTYALVPDAFIIGGGVSKAGDLIFAPLRRHLQEQLFPVLYEDLNLLHAHFENEAGIIGAAHMALDK